MPQVVVLQKERSRSHAHRALIAVLAVVVLLGSAVVMYFVMSAASASATLKKADKLHDSGDLAGEVTLLTGYLKSNPQSAYHYQADVRLGDVSLSQHDYAAAFKWYYDATSHTSKPPIHLVDGLAQAANGEGDTATALTYYKQALSMVPAQKLSAGQKQSMTDQYTDQILLLENDR